VSAGLVEHVAEIAAIDDASSGSPRARIRHLVEAFACAWTAGDRPILAGPTLNEWTLGLVVAMRLHDQGRQWQRFIQDWLADHVVLEELRAVAAHGVAVWLEVVVAEAQASGANPTEEHARWQGWMTSLSESLSMPAPAAKSRAGPALETHAAQAMPPPDDPPSVVFAESNAAATPEPTLPSHRPPTLESSVMTTETLNHATPTAASVEHFYGMIEQAPLAALHVDLRGRVTYLNQQAQSLFEQLAGELGYGPEELVGEPWSKLQRSLPALKGLMGAGSSVVAKLGDLQIEVVAAPANSHDGASLGTAYFFRDVTEQARLNDDAARLKSMVEAMPTAVILADSSLKITYVNPASMKLLKSLEAYLPIKLDQLVGQNIDVFHKNPAHQRNLLSDPANLPRKAQIKVGPEILDLLVSAIRDKDGKYSGPMVTWSIVTEQVARENEVARIQSMMENLPINVVFADRDSKIRYMNPATVRTLKTIEHLLPVPVEKLKDQSFDILHKQPEMQRRIVGDPRNLPHKAKIKLGGETLDLLVSAITDAKGEYIGPMITWAVVTHQVKMADDFERDVKGVVQIVTSAATQMQASSRNLAAASEETARQSQVVAAASEEATTNVETVSSAAEELSMSIAEIARHVQEASSMTSMAVVEADRTNVTIKQLGDSSNEIGQVVKVITSIAQQTNLLALNATIEAARAGEAGKGFAVVANEVKELARQTAKATEEISQKINAIQSATGVAVTAIGSISDSIRKINEISTTIASAVEEQTAATNEISRNVAEAARGTSEVSSNIASVSQAAEEGGRGATDILQASESLTQESGRLDKVTTEFLQRMRAI
jgi:methyl-accepting chemotaxis protein